MTAVMKRFLDAVWGLTLSGVVAAFGERNGIRSARTVLRLLPIRIAARLAWVAVDRLRYREGDRDLWEYPRMRGGQTIRIVPTDRGGRYFALCGFWEPQVTRSIVRTRRQGLMIDVGANFGYFSALWLRFPDARVIAIEPSPAYTPVLRENLTDFVDRARLFEGVVGETGGVANFAGEGMTGHIVPGGTLGSYRVPMTTLPQLLTGEALGKRIEVLKIDAEGYDLTILNANRDLFRQQRVALVLWEKADTQEEQGFVAFIRSVGYQPVLNSSMLGFTLISTIN